MSTPADILFATGTNSPAAPTTGKILLYAKTDNTFYQMDDAGIEKPLGTGSTNTGIDGGTPSTIYGGTTPINGGTP
jgi:hypothetical protein